MMTARLCRSASSQMFERLIQSVWLPVMPCNRNSVRKGARTGGYGNASPGLGSSRTARSAANASPVVSKGKTICNVVVRMSAAEK